MTDDEPQTLDLLNRWHSGDEAALGELLRRDLPWIRERVHRRLGDRLRARDQTDDLVQEACLEALRYAPRFLVSSRPQFRGILATIVENAIRVRLRWVNRQRRAVAKERPLPTDTVLALDAVARSTCSPSSRIGQVEQEAWVRFGIELLKAEDKQVLILRLWEDRSFETVGEELGIGVDAARMRFNRAVGRLGQLVLRLQQEGVAELDGDD